MYHAHTTPHTQNIPVTLLQVGDWFRVVTQSTGEPSQIDTERYYVLRWPRIDRNNGTIVVTTQRDTFNFQNGAIVAREVK